MRALAFFTLLCCLLVGCQKPAPGDYWTDPQGSVISQPRVSGTTTYERLMADGTRANLSGRSSDALSLFRDALKEAEARYGRGRPETALPLMSLALELSVERQFQEADARFAEAETVLRPSKDRALKARLLHYRGIHMLDQKKLPEAQALLTQAQAAYTTLLPEDVFTRPPVVATPPASFDLNSGGLIATTTSLRDNRTDSGLQPILLGLIEVLRYRAIALRESGQAPEAETLTAYAARLAASNDLGRASVYARLFRTAGVTATSAASGSALDALSRSDDAFEKALPDTKPAAETELVRAGELMRAGKTSAALSTCRRAVHTLIAISAGTSPDLMAPCLSAYAAGGMFGFGSGNRDEMFMAAQVAQGTLTSHQIAQASAALEVSARDPAVGEVLRQRDSLQRDLDRIYRALDTLGGDSASARTSDEVSQLQQQADQTQAALRQAEARVRVLAPNYSQLVQDVVPARDVFAVMHPDEVFVALFLSQHDGWTFALRNGNISVARIAGGIDAIGPLVKQLRAGVEDPASSFDIDNSRRLYDSTLGGVGDALRGAKQFVFAPTGPLLSVPFEVLLTGPAEPDKLAAAPWLMRQGDITHVPAPANFVSLRKVAKTSRADRKWIGFGDFRKPGVAQIDSGFPDRQCGRDRAALAALPLLPGATAELGAVRQIVAAPADDEVLGPAFTADAVMRQNLKSYQILHFAAHALLPTDLECQTEGAIVTSPSPGDNSKNGFLLTASRLLGLDLDANLVILSACNSAGGDGRSGESLSGLARSFFFARARSLMVTHWEVSDKVAAVLVALTINNMKDKPEAGVAGALRQAQLSLLDRAASGALPADLAKPFFWAPFAVIGEGGEGAGGATLASSF